MVSVKKGPESPETQRLIVLLEKASKANKAPVWRRTAELLKAPRAKRAVVNLRKLNKFSKEGDVVIVPGKILGVGKLGHAITVAAAATSQPAAEALATSGCRLLGFEELIKQNPKGSNVKIIA